MKGKELFFFISWTMNGPQRTAVSRKESWQKGKQKEFLNICEIGTRQDKTPPPISFAGGHEKNQHRGVQLGWPPKLYIRGQLTSSIPVRLGEHRMTISRSYSRQAVNSLCGTINIALHKFAFRMNICMIFTNRPSGKPENGGHHYQLRGISRSMLLSTIIPWIVRKILVDICNW